MTKKQIKIRTNKNTTEQFNKNKLENTIITETKATKKEAKNIANDIEKTLKQIHLNYITTPIIRELTNAKLIEKGLEQINKHKTLGVTPQDIETLISNGNKDNANMAQNPETIHKYVADESLKQFTFLNILPPKLGDGHMKGDYHCLSGRNKIIYKDNNGIHIERMDEFVESKRWERRITKVPSVDVKTGKITWQKVIDGRKTGHKQCFEVTFTKGFQIECTGDHNLYTYQSEKHQFTHKVTPEKYTSGQRIGTLNKIPHTGRADHYDYCALYGMFLGDGFYENGKLTFHLKKQEKIDYVEELLNNLQYGYHIRNNNDDTITIIVDDIVDFNKSKENLFHDGFVGNMKGLIEGLINSDGYITKHGIYNKPYLEFTSTNPEICDWFTIALMTLGLRPSFQSYINTAGNPYYKCVISGDEIVKVLKELNLREPYKTLIKDYCENHLIGGKLWEHTGLFINDIKPSGKKDVYNITVENNHNYLVGTKGFVLTPNCHDAEYFASRSLNCLQNDLRLFIRYGLKVDGTGDHTSIAAPPTHMETVMNHSGEILLAAQQNMSGGQAFSLWNVFVAPFAKGLPYEKIKQCVEMFIFNLNMAYAARGGQVPFTSVGLEFTVPDFLKDETAWGPGGKACGVYGDYEEETRQIQRAFTEVLLDGDANGKPHLFPNTIYYLRKECLKPEFEEDIDMVHYLSAKLGTAYYINMLPKYMGTHANYMGAVHENCPLIYKKNGEIVIGKALDFEELCTDIDGNLKTYYRRMDEIEDTYEFLTYNPDGSKAWKPLKTVMKKEASKIYNIRTKNGKTIQITSNHKVPVLTKNKQIVKIKSEDLKIGDLLYEYKENKEYISFEDETTDDLVNELVGIFLADGSLTHENNNARHINSNKLEFHLKKSHKISYLCNLLDKTGIEYVDKQLQDGYHIIRVDVSGKLRKKFVECYDYNIKLIPSKYFEDERSLYFILRGMLFDGSDTKHGQVFYASNENLALGFMFGLSILGIRFGYTIDKRNHWKTSYRITFDWNNQGYQPSKAIIKSIEICENNEPVYDFEIEDNHNYVAGWGFLHIENCRTRLSDNWTGDWEQDTLRCGNLAYVTMNLPRMAYKSRSEDELFDYLDEQLEMAKEILLIRRERAMKCLNDYKILPFLTQKFDGEPYYRVENSTLSFGFVGLNETLQSLTGHGLEDKNSLALGHRIIDYINDKAEALKAETHIRWGVIQTPAESTSYRFATMDKKMFPDKAIVHGEQGAYYYSNSNHTPVDTNLSLPDKIRIESPFHPKTQGGHIFHAFMGESYSDPESLRSLTDKICHNSDIGFWAYSSALSYCNKCGTIMKGLQSTCSHCGETREVEWYDRITGYVQQVGHSKSASSGWNAGKKQELVDRRRFEQ